jgi:hypothetical protein
MAIIKIRRGTTTQWNASSRVLQVGELGLDTTLNRIKAGNGIGVWSALPYLSLSSAEIEELSQDSVAAALAAGTHSNITVTYSDSGNSISLATGPDVITQTSLSNTLTNATTGYVPIGDVGSADGVASLDSNGKIPDSEIPATIARDSEIVTSYTALTDKPDLTVYAPKADPTFTGTVTSSNNLVVDGNLTVNGTTFNASSTSITIEDNLVQLAHQNPANTVDLGLVVGYNDGTAKHAGLVKDTSENTWKLFKGVTTEPSTTVDFSQGSLDDLAVAGFTASSITVGDVSNTEFGYLNGVTSAIQTQLDAKAVYPSQSSNSGKYLTTNGTTPSWATITQPSAATRTTFGTVLGYTDVSTTNFNVSIGQNSGPVTPSPSNVSNVSLGVYANGSITNGNSNTAIGSSSFAQNASGIGNTGAGGWAGYDNTSGSYNVFLGHYAGTGSQSGSNNIVIGNQASTSSGSISNQITLGNSSITNFRIPGLAVNWTTSAYGRATYASTSAPSGGADGDVWLVYTA